MSYAAQLGYKQRLYLGITLASSAFTGGTLVQFVKEVKVDDNKAELDMTTRNCNGFKGRAAGLRDLKYTFKYPVDKNDASGQLAVLLGAFVADTTVIAAAVDQDDKNGTAAEMTVMKANHTEDNEKIVEYDFELVPFYAAAIPPQDIPAS